MPDTVVLEPTWTVLNNGRSIQFRITAAIPPHVSNLGQTTYVNALPVNPVKR